FRPRVYNFSRDGQQLIAGCRIKAHQVKQLDTAILQLVIPRDRFSGSSIEKSRIGGSIFFGKLALFVFTNALDHSRCQLPTDASSSGIDPRIVAISNRLPGIARHHITLLGRMLCTILVPSLNDVPGDNNERVAGPWMVPRTIIELVIPILS